VCACVPEAEGEPANGGDKVEERGVAGNERKSRRENKNQKLTWKASTLIVSLKTRPEAGISATCRRSSAA